MEWTLYVDLDAFYVACELRDRPELVGRPVLVGPDPTRGPTRGVVLSASYPARVFGARSAMPVQRAAALVPGAIFLPPDFPKYERCSAEVRELLRRFSEHVVPLSIDEAAVVVDLPDEGSARALAERVQAAIRDELRLSASIGVAPHRTVAKIASDVGKPGGLVVVGPERYAAFLEPLPVRAIPGVGPKLEATLASLGIARIGELARAPRAPLRARIGRFADELVGLARGAPLPIPPDAELPRSRSADRTFPSDVPGLEPLAAALDGLAASVAATLRAEHLVGATVGVAVRWSDFARTQRSRSLAHAIGSAEQIRAEALRLLETLWAEEQRGAARSVRTLSVKVEGLRRTGGRQLTLPGENRGPGAPLN